MFALPIREVLLVRQLHINFAYGAITLWGQSFQKSLAHWLRNLCPPHFLHSFEQGFGLPFALFARCYWGHRNCFLFLPVLRCFNSRRNICLSACKLFTDSEIPSSMLACSSLGLIAACHVLHHNLSQAIRPTAFKIQKPKRFLTCCGNLSLHWLFSAPLENFISQVHLQSSQTLRFVNMILWFIYIQNSIF